MSLAAGNRLGPYEIQAAIGAGGMGEVYKARDTRLDRTVAIKVLPTELGADPERRARFEREARAIAALNHPHICTLHDIGTHDGATYLVMEHLPGQTLAERLGKGPLPLAQALDIAAQIADALDAAHKHGIIHRDLKPGNVMLTGSGAARSGVTTAKLLDFGLAKLVRHGERPALVSETHAATEAAPVTARGTILGTLQYMAPEQLEGKEADPRTDIWALGAILYEMVTGRRAFVGDTEVSLIGNIMNAAPASLAQLQPLTPPSLDRVVTKCLAKYPDGRWDSARDVADELRWIAQTSGAGALATVQPRRRRALRTALGVVGGLAMAVAGAGVTWLLRPPALHLSPARVSVEVRPADELNAGGVTSTFLPTPGGSRTALTWTPDGKALVFVGRRGGVQQLYVRWLDAAEARALAGTEGAQMPAVSADGQWVAFWAGGAIRKAPVGGGPAMELASGIADLPWGLAWDARGRLFFGRGAGGIWQVPPDGAPAAVTSVGEAEVAHVLPCPLPGERALLYTVRKRELTWGDEKIVALTFATGARKVLLTDAADARYVRTGHLVFLRRGKLLAVPFDAERLEVQGAPVAVVDTVVQALSGGHSGNLTGAGQYALAPTGTLAWLSGPVTPFRESHLVSVDRTGQASPLAAPMRAYGPSLRLAPDGRRLVVLIHSLSERSLWLYDLGRGTLTPLARGGEVAWPVWAPDGRRLVFAWLKDGRRSLASQPADGSTPPQVLAHGGIYPSSFAPDGRELAAVPHSGGDVLIATLGDSEARVQPLFETANTESHPEMSPDGRWMAYASDVSGRAEVYVRPYPGPGPAEQVSTDGGSSPAWQPVGKELFFLGAPDPTGQVSMLAVEFRAGPPVAIGRPRRLFAFDPRVLRFSCVPVRCYDVEPDGQRFFATRALPAPPVAPVTHVSLIQNWFEELKAKVPTTR